MREKELTPTLVNTREEFYKNLNEYEFDFEDVKDKKTQKEHLK